MDGVAESLEALTGVAAVHRDDVRAARLSGAAAAIRERAGIPLTALDGQRLERWLEGSVAALGDATFAEARTEGEHMTAEQAVGYALGGATAGR
jgi:hypothetical protein